MSVLEKWHQEGTPLIEALAEHLWASSNFPGKLPWDELGVQGRVGPRAKAYRILDIVKAHL